MEHEHSFEPVDRVSKGGYYKIVDNMPDQRISYAMLYCTKCGETKEVICQNHVTPPPTEP